MNMKKKIIFIILIILVILSGIIIISNNKRIEDKYSDIEKYNNRIIYKTDVEYDSVTQSVSDNFIENDEITLKIRNINYSIKENSSTFGIEIDFFRKDGKELNNIMFDALVYDNDKNILLSRIDNSTYYINGFVEENYSSDKDKNNAFGKHFIFSEGPSFLRNNTESNILSYKLETNNIKEDYELKDITISIFGVRYQLTGDESFKDIENTEFKFEAKAKLSD